MPRGALTWEAELRENRRVGALLKAHRVHVGKSQTELAEAADITRQQVEKIEAGSNSFSVGRLIIFAKILNIDPVLLLPMDGKGDDVVRMLTTKGAADVNRAYYNLSPKGRIALKKIALEMEREET